MYFCVLFDLLNLGVVFTDLHWENIHHFKEIQFLYPIVHQLAINKDITHKAFKRKFIGIMLAHDNSRGCRILQTEAFVNKGPIS